MTEQLATSTDLSTGFMVTRAASGDAFAELTDVLKGVAADTPVRVFGLDTATETSEMNSRLTLITRSETVTAAHRVPSIRRIPRQELYSNLTEGLPWMFNNFMRVSAKKGRQINLPTGGRIIGLSLIADDYESMRRQRVALKFQFAAQAGAVGPELGLGALPFFVAMAYAPADTSEKTITQLHAAITKIAKINRGRRERFTLDPAQILPKLPPR